MSTCTPASRFANGETPSKAWKRAFLGVDTVGDDMSGVEIISRAIRKAAREHACDWCWKTIPKGHYYMVEVGNVGELLRKCYCLSCLEPMAVHWLRPEEPESRENAP